MIEIVHRYVIPAAYSILPDEMASPEATVMLLAIGGQESRFNHRRQVRGPAKGWWQFEQIAVDDIITRTATRPAFLDVIRALRYDDLGASYIHEIIEHNDILACVFARLNLWLIRGPLPAVGDMEEAWRQYLNQWRPGKPHPDRWPSNYLAALRVIDRAATS